MVLEDYFDFITPDDIRLRGHRIGIETILLDYLEGASPEMIRARYPTLSLEEIHATITFYYHRKEETDAYLKRYEEYCQEAERRYYANPPAHVQRFLARVERTQPREPARAK